MKYTRDEYIKLGRTLQKSTSEDLSDDLVKFTTIAVNFKNGMYRILYQVEEWNRSDSIYDANEIINELNEFPSYQEMLTYLASIGFDIDELGVAKGLKVCF